MDILTTLIVGVTLGAVFFAGVLAVASALGFAVDFLEKYWRK